MIGKVYSLRSNYPANTVRVDRQTIFGNPFMLGRDGTRAEVVAKHAEWFDAKLSEDKNFRSSVQSLAGKDLLCWCAPLACHADTIARRAAELEGENT